ncbi:serine protease inhibitor 42Dd-like [Drosophila ananassae]|uniref:serine protease inhibitor 42Dd-like n=1 Tax=Drosophila ananassae TaxID=7217 RepID=UPI001CFF914C|nr:serine protease inhibitor 42Dd-like [Drosophila ananassae]
MVSPLAVELTLGFLLLASFGPTAEEVKSALRVSGNTNEMIAKYVQIMTNLAGFDQSMTFNVANRIYANDRLELSGDSKNETLKMLRTEVEEIDMQESANVASAINKWVKDHTSGMVKDIVSPKRLNRDNSLMAVNGIYFKALWNHPFETKKGKFRLTAKKSKPIQMLKIDGLFKAGYFPTLNAKVIELPYYKSNLSMLIFLPDSIDGLSVLEENIAGLTAPQSYKKVSLELPKFKIQFAKDLVETLKQLSIKVLFTNLSDLRGFFTEKINARVNQFTHKIYMEVTESGEDTKDDARDIHVPLSGFKRMDFKADHPFAFVIRDANVIYFNGHLVNP